MPQDPFLVELGRRLRRRRSDWQLPAVDVAQQAGLHPSSYSQLEAGRKRYIEPQQLARLAEALHTTTDYLLQRSEDRGEIPKPRGRGERVHAGQQASLPTPCAAL